MKKYYIDTSIWIDLYEDRKGYSQEPLGDHAFNLFLIIKSKGNKLVISDFLIRELENKYALEQIKGMMKPFEKQIEKVFVTKTQKDEARKISEERDVPAGDAIHAIVARDSKSILITRDRHFRELEDISKYYKPEDIS